MKHLTCNKFGEKGFTLTELVVAMGVFIVAITIAVGGFVRALKTQRTVNHLMSVNSNASIALEQIVREIRTGRSFEFVNSSTDFCPADHFESIRFVNSKNKKITYIAEGGSLKRQECNLINCGPEDVFFPLTASNVLVDRLCFSDSQDLESDPWRVTLFLRVGSSNPDLQGNVLNLQTTVSSRILPIDIE